MDPGMQAASPVQAIERPLLTLGSQLQQNYKFPYHSKESNLKIWKSWIPIMHLGFVAVQSDWVATIKRSLNWIWLTNHSISLLICSANQSSESLVRSVAPSQSSAEDVCIRVMILGWFNSIWEGPGFYGLCNTLRKIDTLGYEYTNCWPKHGRKSFCLWLMTSWEPLPKTAHYHLWGRLGKRVPGSKEQVQGIKQGEYHSRPKMTINDTIQHSESSIVKTPVTPFQIYSSNELSRIGVLQQNRKFRSHPKHTSCIDRKSVV